MSSFRRRLGAIATSVTMVAGGLVGGVLATSTPAFAATTDNTCIVLGNPINIDVSMSGTASPASVQPGDAITVSGLTVGADIAGNLLDAGIELGFIDFNDTLTANITAKVLGTNTVEADVTVTGSTGATVLEDPGNPGHALPLSVSSPVSDAAFTAGGSTGPATFSQGNVLIGVAIPGIPLSINCNPTAPASAFAQTSVIAPPTAPVAANAAANVNVAGTVTVDLSSKVTDANGNIDWSTLSVITDGAHGSAVADGSTKSISYTHDGGTDSTDSFTYQVSDLTGLDSNVATVSITVLQGGCQGDAGGSGCSMQQVIVVPVEPDIMSMSQAANSTTLGGTLDSTGTVCQPGNLKLNGQPQYACGALQEVTVVNARGNDAQWDLTGQVSDFNEGGGTATCSTIATYDNHCIPGGNLGWSPSAAVAHMVVPGDVATITAGASIAAPSPVNPPPPTGPVPGLHDAAKDLCNSPAKQSGGTFKCNAGLVLAVPASAAAGTYTAVLTLTLA